MRARPFRLGRHRFYPVMFASLALLAPAVLFLSLPVQRAVELLVPVTGAVAGFVYFLYSQQLQQTRLFVDLFRDFNERYDRLNERLNVIAGQTPSRMLSSEERQVLFDYFNLCGEEWMYYRAGYIDPDAWEAWRRGMKFFSNAPEIRRLWTEELESGSYYGFTIEMMER
jgi:hypothetical protein